MANRLGGAIAGIQDVATRHAIQDLGLELQRVSGDMSALRRNNEAVTGYALSSLNLTAGVGLSGGGDLSADRTFNLDNTAVVAGSYTYASVTVDAQGRITSAANGTAPAAAANPTGTIGLTAANGSASTFMRSDGAPALGVGIVPTWTGVHTFSAQDVHNAGVSLGSSGVLKSLVATAGIVYDLQDVAGAGVRTSGTTLKIGRAADTRLMMDVTWDGRFGFGYSSQSSIAQTGAVLGFIQSDSDSPSGAPHQIGILSLVQHAASGQTITQGYGNIGIYVLADATALTARMFAGTHGSVASSTDSSLTGKIAAGVSSALWKDNSASSASANAPAYPDIILPMGAGHLKGSFDHATNFWAHLYGEAVSLTLPTNKPGKVSSFRAVIQAYPSSHTAGTPVGETWGIYGEAPTTGTSTGGTAGTTVIAHYPLTTGFMRVPYPRFTGGTGVRAMQLFFEPWPNTAGIRGGAAAGDVYMDDGTNFPAGLWEFTKTAAGGAAAWNFMLSSPGVNALGGGAAPTLGTIGGGGPATAAQATWIQVNCADGVVRWVPAWV